MSKTILTKEQEHNIIQEYIAGEKSEPISKRL